MAGKAPFYYEKHHSYWGLRRILRNFHVHDYTLKVIQEPDKFFVDYMIKPGSAKAAMATIVAKYFMWLCPGYIWLLKKPDHAPGPAPGAAQPEC